MKKFKSSANKVSALLVIFSMLVTLCSATFTVSAETVLTKSAKDVVAGGNGIGYIDAYKGNETAGDLELNSAGTAILLRVGEWSRYEFDVETAGTYKVSIDYWVSSGQTSKIGILHENSNVSGTTNFSRQDAHASDTYTDIAFTDGSGSEYLFEMGTGKNIVRITQNTSYAIYIKNIKLTLVEQKNVTYTPVDEIFVQKSGIAVKDGGQNVGFYDVSGSAIRKNSAGFAIVIEKNEWAKYEFNVPEAGNYSVSLDYWVYGAEPMKVTHDESGETAEYSFERRSEHASDGYPTQAFVDDLTGNSVVFAMEAGTNTLKIENLADSASHTDGIWLKYITITKVAEDDNVILAKYGVDVMNGGDGIGYLDVNATNGLETQDTTSAVIRDGEWVKYAFPVTTAGTYNVVVEYKYLGNSLSGNTSLREIKVLHENTGNPLYIATPSASDYTAVTVGQFDMATENNVIKIETNKCHNAIKSVKLVLVTEKAVTPSPVSEVVMTKNGLGYAEMSGVTANGRNIAAVFDGSDWAKYDFDIPKAGKYSVTVEYWLSAQERLVVFHNPDVPTLGDGVTDENVYGKTTLFNRDATEHGTKDRYVTQTFVANDTNNSFNSGNNDGSIHLFDMEKGTNRIRIKEASNNAYIKTVTLTLVEAAAVPPVAVPTNALTTADISAKSGDVVANDTATLNEGAWIEFDITNETAKTYDMTVTGTVSEDSLVQYVVDDAPSYKYAKAESDLNTIIDLPAKTTKFRIAVVSGAITVSQVKFDTSFDEESFPTWLSSVNAEGYYTNIKTALETAEDGCYIDPALDENLFYPDVIYMNMAKTDYNTMGEVISDFNYKLYNELTAPSVAKSGTTITIKKNAFTPGTEVIIPTYASNKLVDVASVTVSDSEDKTITLTAEYSGANNKIFVWESLSSMTPYGFKKK